MWEYAVLHPPSESNCNKFCIVHAEAKGEYTSYVAIECIKDIQHRDDGKHSRNITDISGKSCKKNLGQRTWNSLNPKFRDDSVVWEEKGGYTHPLITNEELQERLLGSKINSFKFVFEGDIVQQLYVGDNVMEVLCASGRDSWELIGFVPNSNTLRLLRRKLV